MDLVRLDRHDTEMLDTLAALDRTLVDTYGGSFADAAWNAENFAYPLPRKFELSAILYDGGMLRGYCIASEKEAQVYIHRFAVAKGERGRAAAFFSQLLAFYGPAVALMVNTKNRAAIDFYRKFGFEIVTEPDAVRPFIAPNLPVEKGEIIISEEYRCYLMKRS